MRIKFSLFPVLYLMVQLTGCALIRDDSPPHAQLSTEQIRLADDLHLARDGWPAARWWTRYQDPQLDRLLEQALQDSPTMAMVKARVVQSQSQADLVSAATSLQVSSFAMLNRQRTSSNGFLGPYALNLPAVGLSGPWYTEGTIGVAGILNIDLWGKDRAEVQAAIGLRNAQQAEAAAAELELASGIVQLYYSMQSTYRLLDLLEQARQIARDVVASHQGKATGGLESQVALHEAQARLLAVGRQIVAAQGTIKQSREALRALVGAGADNLPEIRSMPLPAISAGVPDDLSYQLLARRPDLQVMRWYVQSSLSQVEAARAAFYPSFNIKALFALDTIQLSKLFQSNSQQINLIPGLTLPIFDSGALNARLHGVRAASNLTIERYNQAVLNAVRDIAVSGSRLQTLGEEFRLQQEKVKATAFAHDAARAAYQQGLLSRVAAGEAKVPVLLERLVLLGVKTEYLQQQILLTKALGGGYVADDLSKDSAEEPTPELVSLAAQ